MFDTAVFSGVSKALTADKTIPEIEGNGIYTNEGATGTVTVTLPSALFGRQFIFLVRATYTFAIDPKGTEKVSTTGGVTSAAGKNISADADGEYIHLVCVKDGEWTVFGYRGTWTVES